MVARVQYAKFLKETVQDMAKELKKSPSAELRCNADELENFMKKVKDFFINYFKFNNIIKLQNDWFHTKGIH